MRKIAIVGPESSGKTTLAEALMRELPARYISEAAREFLEGLGRPYGEADLLEIARIQADNEDLAGGEAGGWMVCDTDMITIRIWSEEKFGRCDPWIMEQSDRRHYDLRLLCSPDMPWEHDPLRENPHDRDRLFHSYMEMLDRLKKPYEIMRGGREERLKAALRVISSFGPSYIGVPHKG